MIKKIIGILQLLPSKLILALSGFFLVLSLSSCSTVQVSQDYSPTSSFTSISTFNWNHEQQKIYNDRFQTDDLMANRFREAIVEVLTNKGIRQTAQASYLVSYSYEISSRLQTDYISPRFGFGYGRHHRYGRFGVDMGYLLQEYDQGKLDIYIHSTNTGELLWRGTGTQEVISHPNPNQLTGRVKEIVAAVLAQFPPSKQ